MTEPDAIEAFFSVRAMIREAIDKRGGEVFSLGIGLGVAQLEFEIDGWRYNVTLRPLLDPLPHMIEQGSAPRDQQ